MSWLIFEENSYWTITPGRKWFRKWCFLLTWIIIDLLPFRAESICPQSTQLASILQRVLALALCLSALRPFALCHSALHLFALRLFVLCLFALCLFVLCLFALCLFVLCPLALCLICMIAETGFALQLRLDAFMIWNIEWSRCYSALDWCVFNLDNLTSIPDYWILSQIYFHMYVGLATSAQQTSGLHVFLGFKVKLSLTKSPWNF